MEAYLGTLSGACMQTPVLSCISSNADLPTLSQPKHFNELFRQFAVLTFLRHPIAVYTGTGILTRLPSASPLGYTLGPD